MSGVTFSAELGETLKRLLGERTQADLARAVGCDTATMSRIVSQGRVPSRRMIANIADELGLAGRKRADLFRAAGYIEVPADAPAAEAVTA